MKNDDGVQKTEKVVFDTLFESVWTRLGRNDERVQKRARRKSEAPERWRKHIEY
jgi:hypothetical protein